MTSMMPGHRLVAATLLVLCLLLPWPALGQGGPSWQVQGTVVDKQGRPLAHAKVDARGQYGEVKLETDASGRFAFGLSDPPAGVQSIPLSLTVFARGFEIARQSISLPLAQPLSITMTRRISLSSLYIVAYSYHWGKEDYLPYSVEVYPTGRYSNAVTEYFRGSYVGGHCDTTIPNFPQGPYRMNVVWRDRHGDTQTVNRDGTVSQSYSTFTFYNSWSYQ